MTVKFLTMAEAQGYAWRDYGYRIGIKNERLFCEFFNESGPVPREARMAIFDHELDAGVANGLRESIEVPKRGAIFEAVEGLLMAAHEEQLRVFANGRTYLLTDVDAPAGAVASYFVQGIKAALAEARAEAKARKGAEGGEQQ